MGKIIRAIKGRRAAGLLVLLLLSVVLVACGGGEKTDATGGGTTKEPDGVVVRMSNFSYDPKEIRVKTGERVTFVNEDQLAHDVVQTTPSDVMSGERGFESPQVLPGSEWTITFDDPGEYPILCTVEAHYLLGMTGTIIVED